MNPQLQKLLDADTFRVYEKSYSKLTFKEHFFMTPEMKYQMLWRKASFYKQSSSKLLSFIYGIKLMKALEKTHINIPQEVKIGPGLFIGHLGRIVIHPSAVLGKNVNLSAGVTIGQANRGSKKGVPVIGDNVWIGTGAVIVGNVHIGNDVLIAPNAYVNTDIPDHSIVVGNPAVIHANDNATKDYINRTI